MKKRAKRPARHNPAKAKVVHHDKVPLIEHLHELKRRVFYVAACVTVGSITAYAFEKKLIDVLLRPSHGQNFIYTSPLGGINFLFGVCLDIGMVVATPVIIYQLLAFLQPLMRGTSRRFLVLASLATGFVALGGVVFGYFIGLPSALHFLLHQFSNVQIRPLITIQSYVSFVSLYLLGSALMFQLPLILLFINRIKPLKPSGLLKYERHLTVFAFVVAFIMNPTPNIVSQMLVVVPIIAMYQLGIILVWLVNRAQKPDSVQQMLQQDAERQAARASTRLVPLLKPEPLPELPMAELPASPIDAAPRNRPRPYANAFVPAPRRNYASLRSQLVQ